jgi:hypothetical protein
MEGLRMKKISTIISLGGGCVHILFKDHARISVYQLGNFGTAQNMEVTVLNNQQQGT